MIRRKFLKGLIALGLTSCIKEDEMLQFIISGQNTSGEIVLNDIEGIVIADIQEDFDQVTRPSPLEEVFRDALLHAQSTYPNAKHLSLLGDLKDDAVNVKPTSQYDKIKTYLDLWLLDIYFAGGNHDYGNNSQANTNVPDFYAVLSTQFKNIDSLHTLGYGFEKRSDDGLNVIILNSSDASYTGFSAGTASDGVGSLSSSQMTFLDSAFTAINGANERVVILIHYPLQLTVPSGNDFVMERTQRLEIFHKATKWQAYSNNGVILFIGSGHYHSNDNYLYDGYYGKVNNIIFNDSEPLNYTGYTGTEGTPSTQTQFMAYSRYLFNESSKVLDITGVGLHVDYSIDMTDRVTSSRIAPTETEVPVITSPLSITNITTRLATLNCTATDDTGVEHYELWKSSVGGDLADETMALQRRIYAPTIDNFIVGQNSNGGLITYRAIAVDEAGNKSVISEVQYTGGSNNTMQGTLNSVVEV